MVAFRRCFNFYLNWWLDVAEIGGKAFIRGSGDKFVIKSSSWESMLEENKKGDCKCRSQTDYIRRQWECSKRFFISILLQQSTTSIFDSRTLYTHVNTDVCTIPISLPRLFNLTFIERFLELMLDVRPFPNMCEVGVSRSVAQKVDRKSTSDDRMIQNYLQKVLSIEPNNYSSVGRSH